METEKMGSLTIVPTPIGNLEDITLRSLRVLREADLLLCEDTRTTGRLLQLLELPRRPLLSLHARNEASRISSVVERLEVGDHLALLSDAGTPGVSDPGLSLLGEVIRRGYRLEVLPGATALIPALLLSGLPAHPFHFEGFLPQKRGRRTRIAELAELPHTVVLYESPHRVVRLLESFVEVAGPDRPAAVVREISKMHEETLRGTLAELIAELADRTKIRGEIVVVIAARSEVSREG